MGFDLQTAINNVVFGTGSTGIITLPYMGSDVIGIGDVVVPPKPIKITAASPWGTNLCGTINFQDGTGVTCEDFRIQSLDGKGSGISIGTTTVAYKPRFKNVVLANFDVSFDLHGCCMAVFDDCYPVDYNICAYKIQNLYNPDQGDNTILVGTCDSSKNPQAAIIHTSSGGLTVNGTKILEGQWAYDGNFAVKTSDVRFFAPSIENQTVGAIRCIVAPGGYLENFVAMGCEVESSNHINGIWLENINRIEIMGNPMNIPGAANYGVYLKNCTFSADCVMGNDTNAAIPLSVN